MSLKDDPYLRQLVDDWNNQITLGARTGRSDDQGHSDFPQYLTERLQRDPSFRLPKGFTAQDGQVINTPLSGFGKWIVANPYNLPLLMGGAMAGGIGAAGALGGGAASAAGGAGGASSAGAGAAGGFAAVPEIGTAAGLSGAGLSTTAVPALGAGLAGGASAAAAPAIADLGAVTPSTLAGAGSIAPEIGASAAAAPTAASASGATEGASSILPSRATAMPSGILPGGSKGLAAGAADTGILGKATGIAQNLNPILGNAASARAQNQDRNTQNAYKLEELRQLAPRRALGNVVRGNLAAAGPMTMPDWGKPGDAAAGKPQPHYQGGFNAPLDAQSQAAMRPFIDAQIQELLNPRVNTDPSLRPDQSSTADKILGGAALGAGILGAFKR